MAESPMTALRLKTTVQPNAYRVPRPLDATAMQLAVVGLGAYLATPVVVDLRAWAGDTNVSGGSVAVAETSRLVYYAEPSADLLEQVDREEEWFAAHRASLTVTFGGRYVAVHGGRVVDADADLSTLVDRFFRARGNVPGYFDFVGDEPASALAAVPGGSH